MPLLGRHKSVSGCAHQFQQDPVATRTSNDRQPTSTMANSNRTTPGVCESPLFGIRRQLPIVTAPVISGESHTTSHRASGSYTRSRSTAIKSSSASDLVNNINSSSQAKELPASQTKDENTLNSIPKNITRQQIHYAFSIMDTNSDGLIDMRDLSQMLANLGIPIDESILAHVLTGASKRGDHRIGEKDFLDWIGHFVQVKNDADNSPASGGDPSGRVGSANDQKNSTKSSSSNKWSVGRWRSSAGSGSTSVSNLNNNNNTKRALVRSSTTGSSLAALGAEPVPMDSSLRKRRGSGSGLALIRSLSSSSPESASAADKEEEQQLDKSDEQETSGSNSKSTHRENSRQDTGHEERLVSRSRRSSLASGDSQEAEEARNDLRAAFCVFDLDGDGFITLDEVRAGLKLLGESWSPAQLNQLFNRCSGGSPTATNSVATTTTTTTNSPGRRPSSSLRATDMRQRISIEDFVRMLL